MKVDGALGTSLARVPETVKMLEAAGFDGVISAETAHDPFFPLLLAAEHSSKVDLITSIAVAFARSPMNLAAMAHDLNAYSQGRFVLGLGSQIRPHIEKRFSMPWGKPAARMRELILAMRAIWANWYEGQPLDFRGEFYTHTLMTPMFTPEDTQFGAPRVLLAAVGPLMTEVAAEVADGILIHGFTTERYMRNVTLPAIEKGLAKSGRNRADFEICYPLFVVSGADEQQFARTKKATCKQIAFYGSTPAYRPVLEQHGWGALQSELNLLSKQGRWDEMGTLIEDDILNEFAIVGEPGDIVPGIRARFGDIVDRVATRFPFVTEADLPDMLAALKA